jgi:NADP-dependent 3-hydroxy acid dehydrogenase YdfG
MVRTNLEVPMILTQQLMREIKNNEGYIINISSVTATKSNPHGCAYGATKAGLSNFSHSIFDEARKYGVSVVTIHPDMTKTALYRNADFCQAEEEDTYLLPEEVANAVDYVLSQRNGMVVTDITLQPQKHRIMKKHS